MNLAIYSLTVKEIYEQFHKDGSFSRSWLGCAIMPNNKKNRTSLGIDSNMEEGYLVEWVFPNSPAKRAGLMKNDIIVQVNSMYFKQITDIQDYIYQFPKKTVIEINVFRNGKFIDLKIETDNLNITADELPPDFCLYHFFGIEMNDDLFVTGTVKGSSAENLTFPKKKLQTAIPGKDFDFGKEYKIKKLDDLKPVVKRSFMDYQFGMILNFGKRPEEQFLLVTGNKKPFLL